MSQEIQEQDKLEEDREQVEEKPLRPLVVFQIVKPYRTHHMGTHGNTISERA